MFRIQGSLENVEMSVESKQVIVDHVDLVSLAAV